MQKELSPEELRVSAARMKQFANNDEDETAEGS